MPGGARPLRSPVVDANVRDHRLVVWVYVLSLRQLSGKWRLLIIAGLALVPLVPALVALLAPEKPVASEVDDFLISGMLASAVLPIIALTVATAAFGNELEDRTLSNLTLAPIARWRIATSKLAASATLAAPVVALSAAVSVFIAFQGAEIDGSARATVAVGVAFAAGALVYSALFVWIGLVSSRALAIGLLYVFVWEGLFSAFVEGVKYLSVRQYTLGMVQAIDGSRFTGEGQNLLGTSAAATGAAVVFALFALLSVRRLKTMDVP